MTLFTQLLATAFNVVQDFIQPPVRPNTSGLNSYVYEAQQLRLLLADTKRDLQQVRDNPKLTKAQIADRVAIMLGRVELVEANIKAKLSSVQ